MYFSRKLIVKFTPDLRKIETNFVTSVSPKLFWDELVLKTLAVIAVSDYATMPIFKNSLHSKFSKPYKERPQFLTKSSSDGGKTKTIIRANIFLSKFWSSTISNQRNSRWRSIIWHCLRDWTSLVSNVIKVQSNHYKVRMTESKTYWWPTMFCQSRRKTKKSKLNFNHLNLAWYGMEFGKKKSRMKE